MNARAEELLRASIAHWDRMHDDPSREERPATEDCPLCREFYGRICDGCPVVVIPGIHEHCDDTPFSKARAAFDRWRLRRNDANLRAWRDAAAAEIEFLRGLLPGGAGITESAIPDVPEAERTCNLCGRERSSIGCMVVRECIEDGYKHFLERPEELRSLAEKIIAEKDEALKKAEKELNAAREEGGIRSDTGKSIFHECVERAGELWRNEHPYASWPDGAEAIAEVMKHTEEALWKVQQLTPSEALDADDVKRLQARCDMNHPDGRATFGIEWCRKLLAALAQTKRECNALRVALESVKGTPSCGAAEAPELCALLGAVLVADQALTDRSGA